MYRIIYEAFIQDKLWKHYVNHKHSAVSFSAFLKPHDGLLRGVSKDHCLYF